MHHSVEKISMVCNVHPTRSQFSAVCFTQRNPSPQCVSKMLLDAFKGTIRRNPFRGEHIHHERKALKHKKWVYSTKSKILTLLCYAHCGGNIFEHGNQISQRNQNRIRKYVSLFYQVPWWVRIMKNGGKKSCDTLLLTSFPWILNPKFKFLWPVRLSLLTKNSQNKSNIFLFCLIILRKNWNNFKTEKKTKDTVFTPSLECNKNKKQINTSIKNDC